MHELPSRRTHCVRALLAVVLGILLPMAAFASARVETGLVALLPLQQGSGAATSDALGAVPDLRGKCNYDWLPDRNGLFLNMGRFGTQAPAAGLLSALQSSGQSTFEIWVRPGRTDQSGQFLLLGEDGQSTGINFAISQTNNDLSIRLQHSGKDPAGAPLLDITNGFANTQITHLVHTFDGTTETLYIDGVAEPTTVSSSGDFSGWNSNAGVVLGEDGPKCEVWMGDVFLVAVYDRPLTPAEVTQNHAAGPDLPRGSAGPDQATQGLPGQPVQSVTLDGVSPDAGVTTSWTQLSGPGVASFGDDTSPTTSASFTLDGLYQLRLTANDGTETTHDDVQVAVNSLSLQIPQATNQFPVNMATGVSTNPTLTLTCESGATGGRFAIASDQAFTSVVHDSGETSENSCSYVAFADLQPLTEYYWSTRVRDADGLWSDWSAATRFTTVDPQTTALLSFQDGIASYAGTADTDIRGRYNNPFNPFRVWNQGGQDVLRAGRRVRSSLEIYRSLVSFDIASIAPGATVLNAYLELSGWRHGLPGTEDDFVFESPLSLYQLITPWGEGDGMTGGYDPGECTWLHSVAPTDWDFPGAEGAADRIQTPFVQGRQRNAVGHKSYWSSDGLISAVAGWVANPASNHGLIVQAVDESLLEVASFASREHADPAQRPRLVVEIDCTSVPTLCANVCGDGAITGGEACDDGNSAPGDGCDATCSIETGFVCSGTPSSCSEVCGDGVVSAGESCDDGGTTPGDGCDASCNIEGGWECTGSDGWDAGARAGIASSCSAVCGDSMITGGETCDDGDLASGDGCNQNCQIEAGYQCSGEPSVCSSDCGDAIINGAETCDDGGMAPGDGCDAACQVEPGYQCSGEPSACVGVCGDGLILGSETCDDSGTTPGDGCDAICQVEPGYQCSGEPSACDGVCGDGLILGSETCDDSGTTPGDGCDAVCQVETGYQCTGEPSSCNEVCGDGLVRGAEACDDADTDPGDGCDASCQIESGYVCGGEPTVCGVVCGDGLVRGAETCDDGGMASGDGCDAVCQIESGYGCTGEPSSCSVTCGDGLIRGAETCDDGGVDPGDGCSEVCEVEPGFTCEDEPSSCAPMPVPGPWPPVFGLALLVSGVLAARRWRSAGP